VLLEKIVERIYYRLEVPSNVRGFRNTVWEIMDDAGKIPSPKENNAQLRIEIREYYDRAKDSYVSDIELFIALTSITVFTDVSRLLTIAGIGIAILGAFHSIAVVVAGYSRPDNCRNRRKLVFMKGWNKGPISSVFSPLLIILVGVLAGVNRWGYELGIEIMESIVID
jgi:hypothetical protein